MSMGKNARIMAFLTLCLVFALAGSAMAGEWIVDGKAKAKVWNPQPVITAEWSGGNKDGYADGKGAMKWFKNGVLDEKLEGTFVKGKAEGKAAFEMYDAKGKVIVSGNADFNDGQANGKGTITWADGRKYEGDLKNGRENGKGVLTLKNGVRYEGGFKDGMKHGKGILIEADKTKYEGEFVNGGPCGQFTVTLPDGKVKTRKLDPAGK